jgi:hypothetical protein
MRLLALGDLGCLGDLHDLGTDRPHDAFEAV